MTVGPTKQSKKKKKGTRRANNFSLLFLDNQTQRKSPNLWYLGRGNRPVRIISHDSIDNGLNPSASISAPGEIKAGLLNGVFVFAWRDGRRNKRFRIGEGLVVGGLGFLSLEAPLDEENEEDEEEGGEELNKGSPLAPP